MYTDEIEPVDTVKQEFDYPNASKINGISWDTRTNGFWCKWQKYCFFSFFQVYNFEMVRRELKRKNKPCRYLEFFVCLLSCVIIQRIFLKSLDSPVSDAECIIVLFSTDLPNKVSFFWLKLQWKNHSWSYWKVWFRNLFFIKIHNTSPDISDYQDSDA